MQGRHELNVAQRDVLQFRLGGEEGDEGGAALARSAARAAGSAVARAHSSNTLTADSDTAALACCRRGATRSAMAAAAVGSAGSGDAASASRMNTWPHSVHSLSARSSLCREAASRIGEGGGAAPPPGGAAGAWAAATSDSAATALATTMGFESERRSRRASTKPRSTTSEGATSCSLATHTAAVLRTYGSSSWWGWGGRGLGAGGTFVVFFGGKKESRPRLYRSVESPAPEGRLSVFCFGKSVVTGLGREGGGEARVSPHPPPTPHSPP